VVSELKRSRVMAAMRQGWIRMSPHFYIDPADIDEAVRLLPAV
jgi:hypothetical protein